MKAHRPSRIDIYLEAVDRRGRHKATLADGTVLAVSRQPFLDAARALISVGFSPNAMLVGWRGEGPDWVLRCRLGVAAKLTVDETRTIFVRWKPLPSSAVASSMRQSRVAATNLAAPVEASSGAAMDDQK